MRKSNPFLQLKSFYGFALMALFALVLGRSASASLVMTGAYQQSGSSFSPTWTVAPSLIAGMSPTYQAGN
jgi:hypothetical protein